MRLNDRGSATVFICILIPALILSSVMICDACLYKSGKKIAGDAAESAVYTIMGQYSSYLKDNYDIYAFNASNGTSRAAVYGNLSFNLGDSSLYDFKIEDMSVSFGRPIADPDTAYGLIMKSAPDDFYQGLIDEFTERFDILSGFSVISEIIVLKMRIDEAYKEIREAMDRLDKLINGGKDIDCYINMLGLGSDFGKAVDEFNGYCRQLEEIESQIRLLIESADGEEMSAKELLEEKAGYIREKAAAVYESFIEGVIKGLREACKEALGEIRRIVLADEKIHLISDSIEASVSSIDDCPFYLKEILETCTEIIADTEEAFVEQVFEEIRIEVTGNLDSLQSLANTFEEVIENGGRAADYIMYNSEIRYNAPISMAAGKGEDRRGFFESIGKRVLEKQVGTDVCISEYITLPSDGTGSSGEIFLVTSTGTDTSNGEEAMSGFGNIFGIPDNLILNEYILQHFFNHTTHKSKRERYSFMKDEIEYILWGMRSNNANMLSTKAALMTTRFTLDALHVYSDSEKTALADGIAAATAGWWTFGAGVPVMSNLVKISWAICEAGLDTRSLCNGDHLAIMKTSGDWVTDIGIPGTEINSPDFLKMDYEDYLRLYLAAISRDKKILRLLDIVELNSPADFDIFSVYAEVSVSATVSFRSLCGGRHVVEITFTESY